MRANVDPSFVLPEAKEQADAEMADADEDEEDAADDPMIISSDEEEDPVVEAATTDQSMDLPCSPCQ